HVLTRGQGAEPLSEDENLYETLSDGAKVYSTSPVEWGFDGIFDLIFGQLEKLQTFVPPHKTCTPAPIVIRSHGRQPIPVRRDPRPYWLDRGWTLKDATYSGQYKTPFGSWFGSINQSASGRVETFIAHPPSKLRSHPHWPCFRDRGLGWFFVH